MDFKFKILGLPEFQSGLNIGRLEGFYHGINNGKYHGFYIGNSLHIYKWGMDWHREFQVGLHHFTELGGLGLQFPFIFWEYLHSKHTKWDGSGPREQLPTDPGLPFRTLSQEAQAAQEAAQEAARKAARKARK